MPRLFKRMSKKVGMQPGSVVYVGKKQVEEVSINVIDYTDTELTESKIDDVDGCAPYKDTSSISWINFNGVHETKLVEQIGKQFGLHPLMLEDIANTGHRPKTEEAGEHILVVLKMLYGEEGNGDIVAEQVSVLFGDRWVITFQERGEDVFNNVRHRIRSAVPRVRFMSADYLAYALIDAVVDNYFVVLESIGDKIEALEDEIADNPGPESLSVIRDLKRKLIVLRKAVWPLREAIGALDRTESSLIKPSTSPYLRDLYEHTVQVIDTVETFRDMVSGLLDLYHTGVSNRMNEIMKVLTIFATIFIPLGFLAGVYGMNFDTAASPFNLPELGFAYGYPLFWLLAACICGGLLWFFRRKGWL